MRIFIIVIQLFLFISHSTLAQSIEKHKDLKKNYIQLSGTLFRDVQLSGIFTDSKTFVDAVPLKSSKFISALYDSVKSLPDFDLLQFVYANFSVPEVDTGTSTLLKPAPMHEHIKKLWGFLGRSADEYQQESTLLPLKFPYIVPGGRFREIYYWDSFFTILGLLADGHSRQAENMAANFAYLIETYGMIPNGNRIYYLTRSQPPFFSLIIDLICRYKNDYKWGLQYLPYLQKEYNFWMNGSARLVNTEFQASEHVVKLRKAAMLNRYFDFDTIPREESFKEDYLLSEKIPSPDRASFFRNIRAAAESGWDFSSRWFADGKSLISIATTDILPVDLNCLLFFMEDRLSFFYRLSGNTALADAYKTKSAERKKLINIYFWNNEKGFYFDYNWKQGRQNSVFSAAGLFPLYFGIAPVEYAERIAENLNGKMISAGGLITTLNETAQQWDAPNGWAPLQWIAVKALREYEINALADTIKTRWLNLNENVYKRTGRMLEKYNVADLSLFAGGGEYKLQDGFGWTNGVARALAEGFDRIYLLKNRSE